MNPATLHARFFDDLMIGMEAHYTKKVEEADILAFAGVTGDTNPVHMDDDYAAGTMFKQRIAHGMLTASLFSTIFGTILPGPGCIYVSQTLNFRAPVHIGDVAVAHAWIEELFPAKKRVLFACECKVGDRTVLQGEAMLMVPGRD